jgi:diguanylate cyclase (GGDEF)-like protein
MAIGYIAGLCLIAAFTLVTGFLADRVLSQQRSTARIVNISGRQRMLTQRIAKLCMQMAALKASPNPQFSTQFVAAGLLAQRGELLSSIAEMRRSRLILLEGSVAMDIPPATDPAILSVYYGEQYQLASRLDVLLSHAAIFAALPDTALRIDNPDLAVVGFVSEGSLPEALQAAVVACQVHGEAAVEALHKLLMLITAIMLIVLLLEAFLIYRPMLRAVKTSHAALMNAARTDPLTGCLNRRSFLEIADAEYARARRYHEPLAVLMLDIDHFKKINDTYGHPAGDGVLVNLVQVMRQTIRQSDQVGRLGGEEFALLMPHIELEAAVEVARRVLSDVAATSIALKDSCLSITVSIGVASAQYHDDDFLGLLARADHALYESKRAGRNRLEVSPGAVISRHTLAL